MHNLAASNPQKLKELQDAFDLEARTNNIYPLKDWTDSPWSTQRVSNYPDAKKIVLYNVIDQLFGPSSPILAERSFNITADAEILSAQTEGVLFALGGSYGGLSLFVKDGKFQATLNSAGKIADLTSSKPVSKGKVKLRFELVYKKANKGDAIAGSEAIYINDEKVGELPIKQYQAFIGTYDEGVDIGKDLNYPVSNKYKVPFAFTGKLNNVTIDFK